MQTVIRIDFDAEISALRERIVGAIHDVLEQLPNKEVNFQELGEWCEIDGTGSDTETLERVSVEDGVETAHSEYDFFDLSTDDLNSLYGDVYSASFKILNGEEE
jgi:hypothetical protein